MSLIPRLLLAAISALFGVMMVAIAPPTDKAPFFYAFGGFCIAIAIACLSRGRVAQFFGSVVAFGILLSTAWYSISTLMAGELVSERRSQPSFLNSLGFIVVFGVPAAMYLWSARFGFGNVIRGEDKDDGAEL